jgi:hypothetical protein
VAQLSTAQRALDAGDLAAARQAAEAVLSADPGNAVARQVLDRIAATSQRPAPASDTSSRPPSDQLVDGAAWSTFEQRVRARRADRCAVHVREAHERGDADAARAALAELTELAPEDERITPLTALLNSPAPDAEATITWSEEQVAAAARAIDRSDWSDTWLDEPRLTLELDPPAMGPSATASTVFSRTSSVLTMPQSRARRSRRFATVAVASCAVAAAGAAFWITPDVLRLRSATDLLRMGAASESAAEESSQESPPDASASGDAASRSAGQTAPAPVDRAQQALASAPPAPAPALDDRADFARRDAMPATSTGLEQPAARTRQLTEAQRPLATAGTGSIAPPRSATGNLVAVDRNNDRGTRSAVPPATKPTSTDAPSSPLASPAASSQTTQQASLPAVSGAKPLPGVSSALPGVQSYVPPPAPPAGAAASASAERAAIDARPPRDDGALVRAAVEGYRRAYNSLDAGAAARVWPTVDAAALARAFRQLRSQSLTFDRCAVDIGGELARVECDGQSQWVPGVGDRSPKTARRTWHFDLSRADTAWTIVHVNVSQ